MIKYNLTTEELLIIKLIFLTQEDHPENLKLFQEECIHNSFHDILLSLEEKGILIKNQIKKDVPINPRTLEFNKNFLKNYLQHSYDLGMELFTNYPSMINIDGRQYSIKNLSKHYKSFEDFCFAYGKAIKFNLETHKKVMQILEEAKEADLIHYGICEFVISQKWIELEEQIQQGYGLYQTGILL